jgi:UDP-glucose 4-epimerase
MLNDKRPVIFGDGKQSRDFIYVKHVVEANLQACQSNETGAFNIATGKSTSINQLVSIINKVLNKNIDPIYDDPRDGDIKHSLADVSKAELLGFHPSTNFIEELRETAQYFLEKQE